MQIRLSKIWWVLRAIAYKPFAKQLRMLSYIGKPTFINGLNKISLGKKVRIFPAVRLEAIADGGISIGNNVYIGQNCHITSRGSVLEIGEGTDIMANVCITNIDHNYKNVEKPILEQGVTTRITKIGRDCFIGHGAVIQAGVVLGNHVIGSPRLLGEKQAQSLIK